MTLLPIRYPMPSEICQKLPCGVASSRKVVHLNFERFFKTQPRPNLKNVLREEKRKNFKDELSSFKNLPISRNSNMRRRMMSSVQGFGEKRTISRRCLRRKRARSKKFQFVCLRRLSGWTCGKNCSKISFESS